MKIKVGNGTIEFVLGDITAQSVDAIVNAANTSLVAGGGVDAAIHKRGGPKIMEDTRRRFPMGCQAGGAVASDPGNLDCKIIIHAVGPVWHMGENDEPHLLERAYLSSLELAEEYECTSIAFPAISCGAFAFPLPLGTEIALKTVAGWLPHHKYPSDVRFVLFGESTFELFCNKAKELLQTSH